MGARMKPITDPTFQYVPAVETDLKKTFARIRRQNRDAERDRALAEAETKRETERVVKPMIRGKA